MPQAVLGAIGLRESRLLPDGTQRITSRDARTRLLEGLADARALLVLDNCEHLIDACAHLADALLAHSPRLRIVATSREPLGITGESLFVVPPLDEDPAVRLFADRAAAVSPDFSLDGESRPLILDIVRRLDGLPLAIELAAARLRTLPLAEISRRLTDRFRLLTGGSRTALPRHRTLRAVVEWSWELLTPAERLLAERFSVFPAGATPAAVAAVCAGSGCVGGELAADEADELLSSLVDKSLLQPLGDGTRLRMLETIREYGAEKLAARGEVGELRRRHAAHYSAPDARGGAQAADPRPAELADGCCGPTGTTSSPRCATGATPMTQGTHSAWRSRSASWRCCSATTRTWRSGPARPSRSRGGGRGAADHRRGAARGDQRHGPSRRGRAAGVAADGIRVAHPGLTERLDAMDIERYPVAGLLRPVYAMFVKDDGRMRVYLDHARAAGDEWLGATAWLMTAGVAENYGNFDEMRVAAAEALDRLRALGERWGLSMALRIIGNIQVLDGDLDGAVAAFTEASHLLAELGHREDLSQVQLRLAEIAARRGDLAKARQLSAAALSAAESEGSPMDRSIVAAWWAAFEARWGDVDAARPHQAAAERHPQAVRSRAPGARAPGGHGGGHGRADRHRRQGPAGRPRAGRAARTARRSARRTCPCSPRRRARRPSSPSRSASPSGPPSCLARAPSCAAPMTRPTRRRCSWCRCCAHASAMTATRLATRPAGHSPGRTRSSALTRPDSARSAGH